MRALGNLGHLGEGYGTYYYSGGLDAEFEV